MLVDVHSHLHHCKFDSDRDKVIRKSAEKGVVKIIENGLDLKSNKKVLDLAKKYEIVEAALGLYPTEAVNLDEVQLNASLEFIKQNKEKIVAVGEIGLDYLRGGDKEKQKKVFFELISLAEKIKKPVIVHSRRAEEDVVDILESSKLKKIVLHCFCGKFDLVKSAADNGWFFSIPPNIVRDAHFQKLAKEVNINQLLSESDAPYLGPKVGERNEPSNVIYVIKKIAEIKGFDENEVENNLFLNYTRLIS